MPLKPKANAADAEWRAYRGGLLKIVSTLGVPTLRQQGFTNQDMFELRRLTNVYCKSTGTLQDLQSLRRIANKLQTRSS